MTSWPLVWNLPRRSPNEISRANARAALRVLSERRRERETVDRYLAERQSQLHG